jgi:cobaltochelatase CobT
MMEGTMLSKRQRNIAQAYPIVAKALGDKLGVKVVIGGCEAATNGDVIQLPDLGLDPDLAEVAWGYLAHESAHVRFTDMEVYQQAAGNPLRQGLLNSLEDTRIETGITVEYPGTRRMLDETARHVFLDSGDAPQTGERHPGAALHDYVLLCARHRVFGQAFLADLHKQYEQELTETFPKAAVTRIKALMGEVSMLTSTRDALNLADRILRAMKEEMEREKQREQSANQPSQQSGGGQAQAAAGQGGDDQADPGKGDAGSSGQGQAAAGHSGDDQADPSTGDAGSSGQNQGGGQDGASQGGGEQGQDQDAQTGSGAGAGWRAIEVALSATDSDLPKDVYQAIREQIQQAAAKSPGNYAPASISEVRHGTHQADKALAESSKLRASLTGLVQAHNREHVSTRRRGRKVDGRRLYRLESGDARVFRRIDQRIRTNTAVHLLVDISGSMSHPVTCQGQPAITQAQLAQDCALALAAALDAIPKVSSGVSVFPYFGGKIGLLKPHGASARLVANRFGVSANGGTPMSESMLAAAQLLLARSEERKVMIVLTDGQPDNRHTAHEIITRCEGVIDMVGIGIQVEVGHLFPTSTTIHDITELRTRLFDVARRTLLVA